MAQRLILASQSPRRRQLLQEAGWQFEVQPADSQVEESVDPACPPEEYVSRAAYVKAESIALTVSEGVILAADTIAECHGEKLGKPIDRDDAARMLRTMSGCRHRVLTGVALWHRPSDLTSCHVEQTILEMDVLDEAQLQAYLDTGDWVGKAGAFGYQDGLDWVHVREGSESNVVGLPMEKLADWIGHLGVSLGEISD